MKIDSEEEEETDTDSEDEDKELGKENVGEEENGRDSNMEEVALDSPRKPQEKKS